MGDRVDPITVSVIQHRLEAIVQEMGEAMLRTSYSQILNSSRDFSTALCDAEGRLVAQAEHVPIHVGAIPWAVRSVQRVLRRPRPPGDVYLLNDPYHGNNHLPDLTAFVPVFVERPARCSGRSTASHQSDIGGATHGAYNPGATEIWQEGLRITPLKLYDAGVVRDDVLKMIATNVRHPRDFLGDLRAMIGSARVGERRLLALLDGVRRPDRRAGDRRDPRRRRAPGARLHRGVEGRRVPRRGGAGRRRPRLPGHLHPRHGHQAGRRDLTVDLSDSHPQVTGFVNSSLPEHALGRRHGPRVPDRPARRRRTTGTFRPLTVIAKPGTVVWANPPAPRDALHEPLRAGDRRVGHQGAGAGLPDARPGGLGRGASASRSRAWIRGTGARSSGTCSTRGRAAARRRRATAGRPRARARRRAASSSAASRWRRCASRCSSSATSSGRTRAATGATAAASGSMLELHVEIAEPARGQHRRRRRPPRARTGSSAARTACRTATACARAGGATACSRPRRSASPSGRATCSWSSRAAAAATATRASARPRPAPTTARTAS